MSIERYLADLTDNDEPLPSGVLTNLSGLTADERDELARCWPSIPAERRLQLIERLVDLAEDNVELNFDAVFMEALHDADGHVRLHAIRGLWEHTEPDVVPELLDLLRDDQNILVRSEAALALGRFIMLGEFDQARPRDVEAITEALRDVVADPVEPVEVRARAVEALGASSQPWARDLIHDAYDSGDSRLMVSAVHAMGRSADSYWLPTVLTELQSTDSEMRFEAAAAAGLIEDEEAVPDLIELLDDEDIEVREQAVNALGEIGGDAAIEVLHRQAESDNERIAEAARLALDEAEFGDDPLGFRA